MMQKYLRDLIENNSRVIIPDFGAFMVQNTAKGKQISFNDFLKFNDGMLANEIIKAEKLTKTEAAEKIKAFIKEMQDTFAKNRPFPIEGVGSLAKDGMGNIRFESTTDVTTSTTKDESPIDIKKETEVKKEAETKKEATIPPKPIQPKSAAKPEIKPIPSKTKTTMPNKPTPTTAKKSTTSYSSDNSNKKVIIIIVVILAVLSLVGGGLFFFGILGGKQNAVEVKVPKVIVADTVTVDSMPIVVADTIPEPKIIEETIDDPSTKGYHIIAGCFKVPSNATNYNEKLKNEGYSTSIIIERRSGLNAVSYKSFDTMKEALIEWRELRVVNPETWILVSK